jgi:hypothetical protein
MTDLLNSGSGRSFFGAKPFASTPLPDDARLEDAAQTPRRKGKNLDNPTKRSRPPSARARSPARTRKKPPPPRSPKLSLPVTDAELELRSIPTPEHPAMFRNRQVAKALAEGGGVNMIQLRTIRCDGSTLVVQKRKCRLIKRASDDTRMRLLRDDDTIVETMSCAQIQRIVISAKTPTLERATAYTASSTPDPYAKPHKWQELPGAVSSADCLTVIYGNQYLDFCVQDAAVDAMALSQYLLWVAVLASMGT